MVEAECRMVWCDGSHAMTACCFRILPGPDTHRTSARLDFVTRELGWLGINVRGKKKKKKNLRGDQEVGGEREMIVPEGFGFLASEMP
jgi:hypothetical protein